MNTIKYYKKRLLELGCKNLALALYHKIRKRLFRIFYIRTALKKQANHDWIDASRKMALDRDFSIFYSTLKANSLFNAIFNDLKKDKYFFSEVSNCEFFTAQNINWQQDTKVIKLCNEYTILPSQWHDQNNIFYQDIKIKCPTKMQLDEYNPDVKTPWELSRFQHIFQLGLEYKKSQDPKLALIFQNQVQDWINKNPYLLGVNWLCTMDVAIRAINLIWGFHFFKDSNNISQEFWKSLVCLLYDHFHFINNNWEWSDKPNNHYLADILGYLYLSAFFHAGPKLKWGIKKMLEQFCHQILEDGTSYEGSTNYHKLDTEIFVHFKSICKILNEPLPEHFHAKLSQMIEFVANCQDSYSNMVQIGDNDSGKIVLGIKIPPPDKNFIKTYSNFGLTVIKNRGLNITFRHGTFLGSQPTGHFHQDTLAVTLSVNGIPVLVDPGSYCYTSNSAWRNLMRSAKMHNTFYSEQNFEFTDLFQMSRPEQKSNTITQSQTGSTIIIESSTQSATRRLELDTEKNKLAIIDNIKMAQASTWNWHWIFAPEINIKKINNHLWEIKIGNKMLGYLNSTLEFRLEDAFYSAEFGKIVKTKKITAQRILLSTNLGAGQHELTNFLLLQSLAPQLQKSKFHGCHDAFANS